MTQVIKIGGRPQSDPSLGALVAQSWRTLASVHAVVGAVLGAAMIFVAARIRRWKDEG